MMMHCPVFLQNIVFKGSPFLITTADAIPRPSPALVGAIPAAF